MKMNTNTQQGSAHVVIIVVLVVALVGALGWIFWQNFIDKSPQSANKTTQSEGSTKTANTPEAQPEAAKLVYKEYPYDSCVTLKTPADVAQLDNAGAKLKKYLTDNVGTEYKNEMSGETEKQVFAVCSYYGDYAEGAFTAMGVKNSLVGPKDGTGDVDLIDSYQAGGFSKSKLQAANVPQEFKRAWELAMQP